MGFRPRDDAEAEAVNATEQGALLQGLALHDRVLGAADARTLAILERRRSTAVIKRRGWLVRRMLLVADLIGLTAAFALAHLVIPARAHLDHLRGTDEIALFLITLPIWVVVARLHGLYDHDEERTDHTTIDDLVGVVHLVTIGTWITFAFGWLTGLVRPEPARLMTFWAAAVGLITIGRFTARAVARRRIAYLQNTVIVGAGDVGQLIARKFLQHPEYGINLVGFVDPAPKPRRDDISHLTVLGMPDQLPAIIRLLDVERVVFAFSNDSHEDDLALIRSLKDMDVQIDIVPRLFEIVGPRIGIHTVEGVPLIGLRPLRLSRSSRLLKRTLDVVVSAIALVLLSPFFAIIAWRIKSESPGPVFFRQVRMGTGDQTFRIFKFRTMVADAETQKDLVAELNMHASKDGDSRMFKIPDDPRVTRIGAFLRRYSLDELPQLINVLKGEMSLIGARPLILDEDRHVVDWARTRLKLKPGMTGLWQVLGASDIPFEEMTRLDYLYVTNWSLWGDIQLLAKTLPAVLRPRKAY
jgi:exopolysaccharide biosynthesis polyprenyl glycosylphosphotransferase